MPKFTSVVVWAGGALFVAALAFCGYSYVVTWGQTPSFDGPAIVLDTVLFSIFALHHSLFARDAVKAQVARWLREPLLRSTYVWIASALLIAVCAAWRPVGGEVFRHAGLLALAHGVAQAAGVVIIAQAVRRIDALELAGIHPHSEGEPLQIGGPYRWVRHPIYSGWLLLTFGAAHMTGDRLAFAVISTSYLLIAMPFEERALRASFGIRYAEYQQLVRYRLVPYVY